MPEIRWEWIADNAEEIQTLTLEHLVLVLTATGLAVAIALPIGIAVKGRRIPFVAATAVTGLLYTVPSLAMFAFLLSLPALGIGFLSSVIALVLYALLILVRNTVVGLESVPAPVREASRGMGLTPRQVLWRVELPLALPTIVAGIRLAAVSTVGIATIAVLIGGPGLGVLIYSDGIQRGLFFTPILVGAVIATLMAIAIDVLLVLAERLLTPWARARATT